MIKKSNLIFAIMFLTVLSCFTLSSCSDDDNDKPIEPESIVGSWRINYIDGYNITTYTADGKFTDTGFTIEDGNYTEYGSYTLNDDILTKYYEGGGNYNGSSSNRGQVISYQILKLTKDKMTTLDITYAGGTQEYSRVK